MIALKMPDGSVREIEKPVDGFAFAESISKSLAKKAVALKIDGEMKDLSTTIDHDCAIEVVVRESDDGVDLLRHDASHVMAEAVQELFPGTQVTIG
ncbi:TGS domain-containing protein, partial [Parvibaculum sp.]